MTSTRRGGRYNRGQWAVQRERCHIADSTPPTASGEPSDIAQVLPIVLKQFGIERTVLNERLLGEWVGIVGDSVARHARPGRIDGDMLRVFVSDNVWLHELRRFGPKTLVEKIRKATGIAVIRRVQFELDPDRGAAGR